jgi:hypothetical protein
MKSNDIKGYQADYRRLKLTIYTSSIVMLLEHNCASNNYSI